MKINRLEAHDRLQHLIKDQSSSVSQGVEDCLKRNPLSIAIQDKSPYVYIFAHPRTQEDASTKVMFWQPRLTKPSAQTNSYLFRVQSKSDVIEICWMIPPREMWAQYKSGNVTANEIVVWSIDQFENNRVKLESPERDDLPEERVRKILNDITRDIKTKKKLII